jgi:hypothetical protein
MECIALRNIKKGEEMTMDYKKFAYKNGKYPKYMRED